MKYSIKELIGMSQEDVEKICNGCIYGKCPFPKRLMKLREDGYCIKECYKYANEWIAQDTAKIFQVKSDCEYKINKLKQQIKRYKKLLKEIDNG